MSLLIPLAVGDVAAQTQDLTTLPAVREFLQKPATDTEQDPAIQTLITAASAAICNNIAWFLPTETATKTFAWAGGPLRLHPFFLRAATAISIDTANGSGGTAVATADYSLRPTPAPWDIYRWLRFPNERVEHGVPREVTITGEWGFPSIDALPADVRYWATVTVATWLRRDVSAFSTTLRLEEDRLERPDMLPTAVIRGLRRYTLGGF